MYKKKFASKVKHYFLILNKNKSLFQLILLKHKEM